MLIFIAGSSLDPVLYGFQMESVLLVWLYQTRVFY